MKLTTKELILYGLLAAILTLGQISLALFPNIEIVSLLIILFTLCYGKKVCYIIVPFVIMEGFVYGIGAWWFGYLIVWPLLTFLTLWLKSWLEGEYLRLALFSGFYGLIFGALFAVPYIFIADLPFAIMYWIRGLPYDFIHMVGNYLVMLILGKSIFNLLTKLNKQYFQGKIPAEPIE